MAIGQNTAFAYKVLPDLFYPELISVGNNSVIGYNTTILTHEVLLMNGDKVESPLGIIH